VVTPCLKREAKAKRLACCKTCRMRQREALARSAELTTAGNEAAAAEPMRAHHGKQGKRKR
jgi:hypothetical protein